MALFVCGETLQVFHQTCASGSVNEGQVTLVATFAVLRFSSSGSHCRRVRDRSSVRDSNGQAETGITGL